MKRTHRIAEYRDFRKRQICAHSLIFRMALKYLLAQSTTEMAFIFSKNNDLQNVLQVFSQKLPKKASIAATKNFCIKTGQAFSVNRFTRLNRMQTKKLIETGKLDGARHLH